MPSHGRFLAPLVKDAGFGMTPIFIRARERLHAEVCGEYLLGLNYILAGQLTCPPLL